MMRVPRSVSTIASMVVLSLVMTACVAESRSASDGEDSSDETVQGDLGVVLSLSGPNEAYGDPTRAGIELAIEELGEEMGPDDIALSASFLDDEGDPELGAEMFQEHVDDDVTAIIGPTLSNTAFEAHPVAQDAGVPVVAVTNTAEGISDIGDYIFRLSLTEAAVVPQTIEDVVEEYAPETAALVYSGDDAWSSSSADTFRANAEEQGIEIVEEQDVPADSEDVSDAVEAIGDAEPDVIFLAALEHASVEVVLEAREQGLEQRIVCGNGCNAGTFIDATGDASEGTVVGSAWHRDNENEQSVEFVERYREAHGEDPGQFSAQGYAGVQVLAEAMSLAGSSERDDVRDALAELGEVETVLGTFSFDDHRDGTHPAVITIVEDGEFQVLR